MNGIRWVESVAQDVRYAFRQLRHSPGFSAVVIATLGLGIGGTTAVFSVVQAVLIAPLPLPAAGTARSVLSSRSPTNPTREISWPAHTSPSFAIMRRRSRRSRRSDTYSDTGLDLVRNGRAHRLRVLPVTSGYFSTLRSSSLQGRGFDRHDETGARRIVLSDAAWRTHFGSDPSVIGATIQLSAEPYEVVGIAPRDFADPIVARSGRVGSVQPRQGYLRGEQLADRGGPVCETAIGLEQAQCRARDPDPPAERPVAGGPPERDSRGPAAGGSGGGRARPAAPAARSPSDSCCWSRASTWPTSCSCVRPGVFTSSRFAPRSVPAVAGSPANCSSRACCSPGSAALLGLALAGLGISVLQGLGRDALPRLDEVGFDPVVLGFAVLTTVVTAVACGSGAGTSSRAVSLQAEALRQQSRSATGTRGQGWLRNGLAIAQLALALTLLVGAGVLLASFHRLQQVDLGFRVERVLTFDVNLPTIRYDAARRDGFQEELARAIRAIPGVTAAGGISRLPATGSYHPWSTRILSGPAAGTSVRPEQGIQHSTACHQRRPLRRARDSHPGGPPVRRPRTMPARPCTRWSAPTSPGRRFPGVPFDGVVGQRIATGGRRLEIVGVVGDVALDVYGAPTLAVYHAHRQFAEDRNWALTQVVATDLPPERMLDPCGRRSLRTGSGAGGPSAGADDGCRRPRAPVASDSRSS